ncbi:septal ring lytic transglycosylase RlpA family protein [Synechococcus sp. RSCCF101]|uniref:septal ring lytic transglycosylase RlpA family protein n=1 Tax=Synechococcus sp. RSCCF101 TaxID=2511069 RepID=UPI003519F78F
MQIPYRLLSLSAGLLLAGPIVPGVADGFADGQPMQATMATLLESVPLVDEAATPDSEVTVPDSATGAVLTPPAEVAEPSDPAAALAEPVDSEPANPAVEPEAAVLPEPEVEPEPVSDVVQVITGEASWYGPGFYGNRTASGEVFRPGTVTAAHRTLPFGTRVRVTNLWNGRSTVVRINDRGPFAGARVIDLAHGAATELGLISSGIADVKLEVLR